MKQLELMQNEIIEEKFREWRPYIAKMTRNARIIGALDQDITADGMLWIWQALKAHDPERGKFATILRAVVERRVADALKRHNTSRATLNRKAVRIDATEPSEDKGELHPNQIVGMREDDIIDAIHAKDCLRLAISSLSDYERKVFAAIYLAENTHAEAGQLLGTSRKSVGNAADRILLKFRKAFDIAV